MKRIHKLFAATAGALALVAVTAVVAAPPMGYGGWQSAGSGHMGMGMMHGGMGHGGMRGEGFGIVSEQRLTQLKAQLAITAQQEPAWQAYTKKLSEQAQLMQSSHQQHAQTQSADTTAPARAALHLGYMTQHLAGMQAVNNALTELYAVLTPQQRSQADQLLGPMGQGGHGHGMRG